MIVSNTSPLRYLIAVGHADLIKEIFEEVLIPPAVLAELTHSSCRDDVRHWIEHRPAWLNVQKPLSTPSHDFVTKLDPGERESIQLALETHPNFILIDERLGRGAATALGLTVIGVLGLLREGYRLQYVYDPLDVLDEMRHVGFRLSRSLYREFQKEIQGMRLQ